MKTGAFSFLVTTITVCLCENDELFVQIKDGVLRGKLLETKTGRNINAFLGIPYAKPPIGELRFEPPVPADPWQGVLDATKTHAVCPQINFYVESPTFDGNENCLYLNVYKPKANFNKPLPVMVFIHGGGYFACGGNNHWYGPDLLLDKDIVLVVPNYRLGALGFFSTGDEVVPGNNGLKDQNLALKWIRENISKFGGDPDSVTIFGESAGGSSAHFHMLSSQSKGLIHAAISQSGTAFCSWALDIHGETVRNSKKLAEILGCPSSDNREMLNCMKGVNVEDIPAQDKHFKKWNVDPMILFKPVIEFKHKDAFLDEHPVELIKSGSIANEVPWINGLNTDDGALRASVIYNQQQIMQEFEEDFIKKVALTLQFKTSDPDSVAEKIRQFYFSSKSLTDRDLKQSLIDMYTDGWFLNAADIANYLHLKYLKHPIYYYLFGYRGNFSMSAVFGDPHEDYGVCHADELQYLFGHGGPSPIQIGSGDYETVKLLTTLWTDFAANKKPTHDNSKWSSVTSTDEMEYLFIKNPEDMGMKKGLYQARSKFWRTLPMDPRYEELVREEL